MQLHSTAEDEQHIGGQTIESVLLQGLGQMSGVTNREWIAAEFWLLCVYAGCIQAARERNTLRDNSVFSDPV